jgi:hypothetical protein
MNTARHMHVGEILHSSSQSSAAPPKCRCAKARPDPDFKYFSNRTASRSLGNSIENDERPGTIPDRVAARACVVPSEAVPQVARDAHVVATDQRRFSGCTRCASRCRAYLSDRHQ